MGNIWFTSDTHYGHRNILEYCKRPFSSIDEHDEALIERFNEAVGDNDIVYHVGDFALCSYERAQEIGRRLNGKEFHIILGNHDKVIRKNHFPSFSSAQDVLLLKFGKSRNDWIWLSHYAHARWPHAHHGALHLFGHSHGSFKGLGRSMDVGVDTNDYRPYHIDEVRRLIKNLEPVEHHGED